MKAAEREIRMIAMGLHAGCLLDKGVIEIPKSPEGEDVLSDFIVEAVDIYSMVKENIPFCLYCDQVLEQRFGVNRSERISSNDEDFAVVVYPIESDRSKDDGFELRRGSYWDCVDFFYKTEEAYDQWQPILKGVRK